MGATFSTEPEAPLCDIEEVLPTLQTGDIILFDGVGLSSAIIKFVTRCPWSHVAMVVRPALGGPLIWESTKSSWHYNIMFHRRMNGINLSSLRDRLQCYDGNACVIRRLHRPLCNRVEEEAALCVRRYNGSEYDGNIVDFVISMHGSPLGDSVARRDDTRFFCSHLVAQTLIDIGALPREDGKPAMEYIPMDFSVEGDTRFNPGFSLGPPVRLSIQKPCENISIHLKAFESLLLDHPT